MALLRYQKKPFYSTSIAKHSPTCKPANPCRQLQEIFITFHNLKIVRLSGGEIDKEMRQIHCGHKIYLPFLVLKTAVSYPGFPSLWLF
ncbi:hypothetical protein BDV27DRAFT_132025 [Aspergillus caelatus]|uniref:Uncharacterized protein n=1 Tax=Aspergillus caelatus TaxID=61420 RepID=A0A5N6ZXK7_9EURO|nr:uncharacterized protein BDV27DRAFT_132025 [Aspergillus caelatus]KAE8362155.1 hypothetical protein BDV27DRAFT_132025 [Aspergillus caelatus]